MIRRWREEFLLVKPVSAQSDGMGGLLPTTYETVQKFKGQSLASDEPVNVANLGVSSSIQFDIITPTKLPPDWLKSKMEIHSVDARLRIIRQRDLRRICQITVEVIDG